MYLKVRIFKMKFFEVRDDNGFAIATTEDSTQAISTAVAKKAKSVVVVNADCGDFTDGKVIWSR
jgi:exopolysaccharide biosynthesis protein